MSNKIKMKYSILGNIGAYSADVRNTTKGIEISNLSKETYDSADSIRDDFLYQFVRPYSKIDPTATSGKKKLIVTIKEDIKKLEEQIEAKKLAIAMCRRKHVYFK